MKKTFKRFLGMLLVSCMAFSMVAGASEMNANQATEDYWSMTNEEIADIAQIFVSDVEQIRESYVGEDFNQAIEEYLSCLVVPNDNAPSTYLMSQADWDALKAKLYAGVILVSKNGSVSSYNHGHAAICWGQNDVVEHPGKKVRLGSL